MQNLVPDAMRLNKFVHVEIPDNSVLFLRVQGRSLPHGSTDVEVADFSSRKIEKLVLEEQQFLQDYQNYANEQDSKSSGDQATDDQAIDDQA